MEQNWREYNTIIFITLLVLMMIGNNMRIKKKRAFALLNCTFRMNVVVLADLWFMN